MINRFLYHRVHLIHTFCGTESTTSTMLVPRSRAEAACGKWPAHFSRLACLTLRCLPRDPSLSTSYVICEALGFEWALKQIQRGKNFLCLYTALIAMGVIFVLFLGRFANTILLWSQVLNGFLLPVGDDLRSDPGQSP